MKNPLVVKSNDLVQARYRLTLTEQRLILMAAVQARENSRSLLPNESVTLTIADFASQYNLSLGDGSLYRSVREAVTTLYNRSVTITDATRTGKVRWVSEVWYKHDLTAVQLVFSPSIIPFITNLKQEFTSYRLAMVAKMNSVYAVRLYELLLQYQAIGSRSFDVYTLRETLGLLDEYPLFANLKARVIDVAVEQINTHTDIKVKYETRKTGRKITHLDFKIKEKTAATSSRPKIDRAYIDKNARPGESYEQARDRLAAQRDKPQQNLID